MSFVHHWAILCQHSYMGIAQWYRMPDSWSKGFGFDIESCLSDGRIFLLSGQLSVLTLILVSSSFIIIFFSFFFHYYLSVFLHLTMIIFCQKRLCFIVPCVSSYRWVNFPRSELIVKIVWCLACAAGMKLLLKTCTRNLELSVLWVQFHIHT